MTEMLSKEFSRQSFLKGGGALVVGFSVAGAGLAVSWFVPLATELDLLLGGGVDLFANRREFLAHGRPALSTERVAIWLGAGVAFAALDGGAR